MEWLRKRLCHAWRITRWGWFVIYQLGWITVFTNADLLIGKYGSDKTRSTWESLTHPHWGWKSWAIGALAIAVLFLIEGSYRSHRDIEKEKEEYKQKLDELENTKPRIVLCYPKCEYVENVGFKFGNLVQGAAPRSAHPPS